MSAMSALATARRHAGFSLMEVLVSVLVLSIGLLGVAGLQLWGLRYNQSAYQHSQATAVVADLIDRMRANPQGVEGGEYDDITIPDDIPATPPSCISDGCDSEELAEYDVYDWGTNSLPRLGGGTTAKITGVAGDGATDFTITVSWNDLAERNEDGDLVARKMETQVRLPYP